MNLKKAITEAVESLGKETGVEISNWSARPYLGIRIDGKSKITDIQLGATVHSFLMSEDKFAGLETEFIHECRFIMKEKFSGGTRILWFKNINA